ncbi:MAG: toll/interleukin-1 receptor domain-containing protein [Ktedonobacteraceae bacterium]|nr:toll/interleukin-1 receptor domain-containing protein [Ktedonobacteraceae bacterium]
MLKNVVLICTIVLELYAFVQFLKHSLVEAHSTSIGAGIVSVMFFFLPGAPAEFLSFCCAAISYTALIYAEYLLLMRRKRKKSSQKHVAPLPQTRVKSRPPRHTKVQRDRQRQEQIVLAQNHHTRSPFSKWASRTMQPRNIPPPSSQGQPKILILHCDTEEGWFKKFQNHLQLFEKQGMVESWDESCIPPGAIRQDEMERAVSSAKVVVLFVSGHFLNSRFTQLLNILHHQSQRQHFWICPVIVRSCLYDESPLHALQPFYADGNHARKPLAALPIEKQEESLRDLARAISNILALPTRKGA